MALPSNYRTPPTHPLPSLSHEIGHPKINPPHWCILIPTSHLLAPLMLSAFLCCTHGETLHPFKRKNPFQGGATLDQHLHGKSSQMCGFS